MPALKIRASMPILGLDVSKPGEFIDPRATPSCQNIDINRFTISKRAGTAELGASLGERVMALFELQVGTDTYFVRLGLTKVELLNKSTGVWSSIASAALTGTLADRFDAAFPLLSGAKIMTFTNGIDAIRKYTGTGNDANLGGSPPKCKFMVAYKDYLVLLNVTDSGTAYPFRVQWGDTGAPETWSGGNSGSVDLIEDGEDISGGALFGDFVAVHKRSSIYLGYLVATSDVFRFDRKVTGAGAVCFATIQNLPTGEQIFLSLDGIRLFNGVVAPLIPSQINEEIRESMNPAYVFKCWSVVLRERNEYWVGVPIGSQTEPETVYKYNFLTGQCYKDTRTGICAAGKYENTTQTTWNSKTETWDVDTTRWNDVNYLSLNPVVAFGDTAGVTSKRDTPYTDWNGAAGAISAFWESKDYTAEDLGADDSGRMVRWLSMQIWAKGSLIKIEYSVDSGLNWTPIKTLTLSTDYPPDSTPLVAYFDKVSTKIRFRFSNATVSSNFVLKQFIVKATPREERK